MLLPLQPQSKKVHPFVMTFLALSQSSVTRWRSLTRKVGRVIDRAGLEIRYTPFGYRGFESLTFRKKKFHEQSWNSFFNPLFYAPVSKPPLPPVPLVNTFVVTWLLTPSLMAMALMVVVSSMVKGWVYSVSFASGSSPFSE